MQAPKPPAEAPMATMAKSAWGPPPTGPRGLRGRSRVTRLACPWSLMN